MPPMRRPFISSKQSAAGDTQMPGQALPPQPGMTGAQPQMPMGGKPAGDPMQAMGANGAPPPAMGMPNAGGPTSPLNITQMLQSTMGGPAQGGQPGGQPGAPPQGAPPATLPAWGSEGTGMPGAGGPKRVPFGAPGGLSGQTSMSMPGMGDEGEAGGSGMPAGQYGQAPNIANLDPQMMKLLRTMGRI